MISNVYSVYDAKLKAYGRPWFEMTKGSAIRLFTDAVNDASPNNQWNKHPEDFFLYQISVYDDETGSFLTDFKLQSIISASSVWSASAVWKEPKEFGFDFAVAPPKKE